MSKKKLEGLHHVPGVGTVHVSRRPPPARAPSPGAMSVADLRAMKVGFAGRVYLPGGWASVVRDNPHRWTVMTKGPYATATHTSGTAAQTAAHLATLVLE